MGPERKLLERIIKHMEKQGEFATTPRDGCRYRVEKNKNGKVLKCGVGCLIPKSKYDPFIEGIGVAGEPRQPINIRKYERLVNILSDLNLIQYRSFLTRMQELHDNSSMHYHHTFDDYLEKLKGLRKEYA